MPRTLAPPRRHARAPRTGVRPCDAARLVSILASLILTAPSVLAQASPPPPVPQAAPSGDPGSPDHSLTGAHNILILLADDLGVDMIGAYGEGSDLPPTPNLDALAAGGIRFRNAWACPVCSPTRATIQTGRYGFRTGIGEIVAALQDSPTAWALDPAEVTIPEMLDLGTGGLYAHAAIGKWHLGNATVGGNLAPNIAGYGHYAGILGNIQPPDTYFSWPKVVDGVTSTSTAYATTDQVDEALSWIQAAPEPWLAYVAFSACHGPFHNPPANLHSFDLSSPTPRLQFKAMTEALDTEIGRLLAGIPPAVRANTVIVFLGDNGTPKNVTMPPFDPTHAKATLYEGGVRVPLIVNGPPVAVPGSESLALVQTTDLLATIADLAGVDLKVALPGVTLDSVSLLPYLRDPTAPSTRSWIYAERFKPNGLGQPPPPPACPSLPVCQADLGYGGPGSAVMTICGDPLFGGNPYTEPFATLDLQGASPNQPGILLISPQFNPTPFRGGTLVPWPPVISHSFTTASDGTFVQQVKSSKGRMTLYYQALIWDPAQPQNVEISNTLQVEMYWTDVQAIRDSQYKLMVNPPKCIELFFDLLADPFEQQDLLAQGPLTPAQQESYDTLKAQLAELRP